MNLRFNESLDNIHNVIYFTSFEKKVINTPFFQRLHDVNQSSTVYLTFPTNRTKRYEHSLGVMQIASDLFYNASINASNNGALEKLIAMISSEFEKVINHLQNKKSLAIDNLDQEVKGLIDFLNNSEFTSIEAAKELLEENFYTIFSETCLFDLVPRGIKNGYDGFLYICMLEAIRLGGLMHDLGHPPQSHIIEEVLKKIYDELNAKSLQGEEELTKREKNYLSIFDKYNNLDSDDLKHIDENIAIETQNRKIGALHEMIGLHMVRKVFNWILPDMLNSYVKKSSKKGVYLPESEIMFLFYITVVEFVFGLLRDKTPLFISMHKIIDGTIDADRLDFIQRDSQNTGMVWGQISYKRIINTAMLEEVCIEKKYEKDRETKKDTNETTIRVCFSNKSINELDEMLINRFKDYSMINLHHRNVRIEHMYKSIIQIMIYEYLESKEPDSVCDKLIINNISGLWRNLEFKYNKNNSMLCLMQWTDVWLNGLLQNRLVENYFDSSLIENKKLCLAYLKEIFLNEGKHISVIKRRSELMQINNAIEKTVKDFCSILNKYLNENLGELREEEESIYDELWELLYSFENPLNWSLWVDIFGYDFIRSVIEKELKNNKKIFDYMVVPVTLSTGTNMRDVFIYNVAGVTDSYDIYSDVDLRIEKERESFPYFYVYVRLYDNKMPKTSKKQVECFKSIRQSIGVAIGESLISQIRNKYEINGRRIECE